MRIYNPTTSSGGGSGETGPTGASGLNAALTFAYRLDLSGTQNLETLPSQGEIRFAGGSDFADATHLLVHKNSIDLNNVGSIFLSLERGHLTLTSQTQPNNFATYSFSQVEDSSGFSDYYVIFHVSLVGQFNAPSDDDVISFGIAVTGETGATGPQGLQGPGGGGGAGGLMFYLNQNTSPDSPLTGLPTSSSVVTGFAVKELGRIADTVQSTITSSHLPTDDFNIVAAFLSDAQDPNITSIPPGLWDVNFWASSTANTNNQTVIMVIAYKYNGTSKTEIARSDDMYVYDPVVITQYTANIVVEAGIAITANDRIYIEILAKGTSNNYTVTLKFGGNTPAHVHTTIPSVSGTGLVKVENGLFKTPASLLVDADISTGAAISLSKISGLTPAAIGAFSTADIISITNGGTGAITTQDARAAMGGIQQAAVRSLNSLVLASAGTITSAVFTSGSAVVTFASTTATLVPGQSLSAGINNGVIRTVDIPGGPGSPGQITMSVTGAAQGTVSPTVFNATRTTLVTSATTAIDGKTLALNDVVLLNQTASAQSGPWVVTGGVGSAVSLTRPSWFTGNLLSPVNMLITAGSFFLGHALSICLNTGTPTTEIGIEGLALSLVSSRGNSNAVLGGNTFNGKNTFQAGAVGSGAVPFAFQAGVVMTTPQAHSVEWDSNLMYLTPLAAAANLKRGINASYIPALTSADILTLGAAQSTVQLNALTSTSAGVLGQTILDTVNDALYICTSSGVAGSAKWRKVTLSTF